MAANRLGGANQDAPNFLTSEHRRNTIKVAAVVAAVAGGLRTVNTSAADLRTIKPPVREFDAVMVDLPATVTINPGDSATIVVRAEQKVLDTIKVEQSGKNLAITSVGSFETQLPVEIELTTPALRLLESFGTADIAVNGKLGSSMEVKAHDATDIKMRDLNLDVLIIDQQGSTDISAQGRVRRLELNAGDSSDFDGSALASVEAKVRVSGASDASIDASSTLLAVVKDAGSVYYSGSPTIEKDVSFSGTFEER